MKINQPESRDAESAYFVFNKPCGVLCQFTDSGGRRTLSAFGPFPRSVYSVGRLDADSEGLLLLTNDGSTKHLLLDPKFGHTRTYLAQVERIPNEEALERLRNGLVIEGARTRPAAVEMLREEPKLPEREVAIRFRKTVPTCWLRLTLSEGRNRQVRKMTAAVGHPTLRLVRTEFGPLTLAGLKPGESRKLSKTEVTSLLAFARRKPT